MMHLLTGIYILLPAGDKPVLLPLESAAFDH